MSEGDLAGWLDLEAHTAVRDRDHADDLPRLFGAVLALDGDDVADLVRIGIGPVFALFDDDVVPRVVGGDQGVLEHEPESKATRASATSCCEVLGAPLRGAPMR